MKITVGRSKLNILKGLSRVARIVHTSESLATGVLSVIAELIRDQIQSGHEVWLIGSQAREDTLPTWQESMPRSMTFIEVPMRREISPCGDFGAVRALRRLLRMIRPDILHLHSSKAGAIGRLAAIGLETRVFYQPHGPAFLRGDVSPLRRAIFRGIERALACLGGTIIACSRGEFNALKRVVPERQVALVNNGISMAGLPRRSASGGLPIIGTCGRISPQKDPFFFARVASALRGLAEFTWVGDGEAAGKQVLLDAGVTVTGWRTREQCLGEIAGFDVYVQTSAWEGMPISVIEAMAIGIPVVATDIIGNSDLVAGTEAGVLVSTSEQMAAVLRGLLRDSARRGRMAEAALDVAHSRFSSEAMVRQLQAVYGLTNPHS